MNHEHVIDDLIRAGWIIIDASKDEEAAARWKTRALECLTGLLGGDHVYVANLKNFLRRPGRGSLLAGTGILTAAKEELARDSASRSGPMTMHCLRHRQEDVHENRQWSEF